MIFRERVREEERQGEKHQCERETFISCLSYASQLGTKPANQPNALTENPTSDLLLCGMTTNQNNHTC